MMTFLEGLILLLAVINLLLARFALLPLRQPTTIYIWVVKVAVCGLSPILFLCGALFAITGGMFDSPLIVVAGSSGSLLYAMHMWRVIRKTSSGKDFETAFGKQWKERIPANLQSAVLARPYEFVLPKPPEANLTKDVCFYTIPENDRHLLCDIWEPPAGITRSGLAFIYLHGSAWAVLDKDYGTRTFFRHLAAQGHVVMDVAYRLFPETDFMGMLHDTKHAIAWLKTQAAVYGVHPDRIVAGGGSAGAHLALLAGYTVNNGPLTPSDLHQTDLSVRGIVSLYGQSDLAATYYHTCQDKVKYSALAKKKKTTGAPPSWFEKKMGAAFHRLGFDKDVEPGMLEPMLGGSPQQKPEAYALYSPVTYVHKDCPATLILHGEHDILAPTDAMVELEAKLRGAGVPVVMHTFPQTDHAFDLIFPAISPSAHGAYYMVDRFLGLMCSA